ncbi:MAG: Ig-like domain-containing protein, partial [Hominilimicola sp.]
GDNSGNKLGTNIGLGGNDNILTTIETVKAGESNAADPTAPIQNIWMAAVSASGEVSAFIDRNGNIMTVGSNSRGQLGTGLLDDSKLPVYTYSKQIKLTNVENNHILAKAGTSAFIEPELDEFNVLHKVSDITPSFKYTTTNPNVASFEEGTNEIKYNSIGSVKVIVYEENTGLYALCNLEVLPVNTKDLSTAVSPQVVVGDKFSAALTSSGKVYTWGDNQKAQTGFITIEKFKNEPYAVQRDGKDLENIVSIAAGDEFMLAVDRDGTVWSWGRNSRDVGQLGRNSGIPTSAYIPTKVYTVNQTPPSVTVNAQTGVLGGPDTGKVIKVVAAGDTAAALTEYGTVYVWGANDSGKLGIGPEKTDTFASKKPNQYIPQRMYGIDDAIDIIVAENNIAIINADSTMYITGSNEDGLLANGQIEGTDKLRTIALPVMDGAETKKGFVSAAIGTHQEIFNIYTYNDAAFTNAVYAYGRNVDGVLGNGINNSMQDENGNAAEGGKDALGRETKGTLLYPDDADLARLYSWTTQMEVDDYQNVTYTDIPEIMQDVVSVFAGDGVSGAVTQSGEVYMWGTNGAVESGILGHKTFEGSQYKARTVYKDDISSDSLKGIIYATPQVNGNHMSVISNTGVVYSWGYNDRYQLGNKNTDNQAVPVVTGSSSIVMSPSTMKLKIGGREDVVIMNSNKFSIYTELENNIGSYTWKSLDDTIVKVATNPNDPTIANITAYSEGETRIVATNTVTGQSAFNRVVVTDGFTYPQMQLGKDFTIALKKDGTLWAWGNNENNYTGTGTAQDALTVPVQIEKRYSDMMDTLEDMEKISVISVGENHAIALGQSGSVYVWGDNTYGQLGLDPTYIKNVDRPVRVALDNDSEIISIAAGTDHTVAVTASGEVYAWGRNNMSQLGRKTVTSDNDSTNWKPQKMRGVGDSNVTGVVMAAANKDATALLLANGTVWTVGGNTRGELGSGMAIRDAGGNPTYSTDLVRVEDIGGGEKLEGVNRIVGRGYNFAAISEVKEPVLNENGEIVKDEENHPVYKYTKFRQVYTWGDNSSEQLGTNDTRILAHTDKYSNLPTSVTLNNSYDPETGSDKPLDNISNISIGYYVDDEGVEHTHMLATDREFQAYAWGSNDGNMLGVGIAGNVARASKIIDLYEKEPDRRITGAVSGGTHSAAFIEDGLVYMWGSNDYGQLGNFKLENANMYPNIVYEEYIALDNYNENLKVGDSVQLTAAYMRSFSLDKQIDLDKTAQIEYVSMDESIAKVSATGEITAVGEGATKIYAKYTYVPEENLEEKPDMYAVANVMVTGADAEYKAVPQMALGNGFTVALKSDGTVWTWGSNDYGQLGIGGRGGAGNDMTVPANKLVFSDDVYIVKIAAGEDHAMALDSNGDVWTWGSNEYGQLGLGNVDASYITVPRKINLGNITDKVSDIFAGPHSGYIITDKIDTYEQNNSDNETVSFDLIVNRNLYAFGNEDIENSETGYGKTPVLLSLAKRISKVSNGVMLKTSGTVWNLPVDPESPILEKVQEDKLTNIVDLSSGSGHVLLVDADGNAWSYGANNRGQLGICNVDAGSNDAVAVRLSEDGDQLSNVVKVEAGDEFSMAMTADGSVYTWGDNTYGQLGTNQLATYSHTPTVIVYENDDSSETISIAAGSTHGSALKSTGYMWTFGENTHGQLGNEDTTNSIIPVLVGKGAINVTPTTLNIPKNEVISLETGDYALTVNMEDAFNLLNKSGSDSVNIKYESLDTTMLKVDDTAKTIEGIQVGKALLKVIGNGVSALVTVNIRNSGSADKTYPMVAVGQDHTVVLKADGTVWTWGSNEYGQLGRTDGNTIFRVEIPQEKNPVTGEIESAVVVSVAAGKYSSYAVTQNGRAYSWGDNSFRQLGVTAAGGTDVQLIKDADGNVIENVSQISADDNTVLIMTTDGKLYGLGEDYVYTSYKPSVVSGIEKVSQISGMYALTMAGTVWKITANGTPQKVMYKNSDGDEVSIVKIAAGKEHLLALDDNGNVWAVGNNEYGQLGIESTDDSITPILVKSSKDSIDATLGGITGIAAGAYSSYAVSEDNIVYAWGLNTNGQLGLASGDEYVTLPEKAVTDKNIFDISAGYNQTFIVDEDGNVWGAGSNEYGQLANGESADSNKFIVCGDSQIEITKIDDSMNITSGFGTIYLYEGDTTSIIEASFDAFNVYDKASGTYQYEFTSNNTDVLGIDAASGVVNAHKAGTAYIKVTESVDILKTSYAKVVVLPSILEGTQMSAFQPKVVSGKNHTVAVRYDGSVWGYGVNDNGQLGTGDNISSDAPVKAISFAERAVDVAAGADHTLILDAKGNVWAAGSNEYGQLGTGSSDTSSNQFTKINGLSNVVAIAAGNGYSIALTDKGNVFVWGNNARGQIGLGETASADTPRQLVLSNIRAISAGSEHSMFVRVDGVVYATGNHENNRLGIITDEDIKVPVRVPSLVGMVDISAGDKHTLALNINKTVSSFGNNENGELGISHTNETISVETIEVISEIIAVSAGYNHSLALDINGRLWAWGLNNRGQLGLGGFNDGTIVRIVEPKVNEKYLSGVNIVNISAGTEYSNISDSEGMVYGFGDYTQGQTFDGITEMKTYSDTPVVVGESRLFAGNNDVAVNKGAEKLLEVPESTRFNLLTDYNSSDKSITAVSKNENIAKVNIVDGKVYVTGVSAGKTTVTVTKGIYNVNGTKIGDETILYFVTTIGESAVVAPVISSGYAHTLVLKEDGSVWAFGSNEYGQLGIGIETTSNKSVPVRITALDEIMEKDGSRVISVYAGEYHSVALTDTGKVYTWGSNEYGQLGLTNESGNAIIADKVPTPTLVNGLPAISKIAAGAIHTVALAKSGLVYTWGDNQKGQLGNGDSGIESSSAIPQIVKNINKMVDISGGSGGYAVRAISYNGEIWGWGDNTTRQIDPGSNTDIFREPVKIKMGEYSGKIARIYDGLSHSIALLNDGSVISWGSNQYEQLGRDIIESSSASSQHVSADIGYVETLDGTANYVVDIAVGATHNLALLSDQTVVAWGDGTQGRLGLGNQNNVRTPEKLTIKNVTVNPDSGEISSTETDMTALIVAAGGAFSVVGRKSDDVSKNGLLYAFGLNNKGQLATGEEVIILGEQTNLIQTTPRMVAGSEPAMYPQNSVMKLNATQKMDIRLPKFYIVANPENTAELYISTIDNNPESGSGDVITFKNGVVTAVGIGNATLMITDAETHTTLASKFTVQAAEKFRATGLFFDETKGTTDEDIFDWFMNHGYLRSKQTVDGNVVYEDEYDEATATLKNNITQLYKVIAPVTDGKGTLIIAAEVNTDTLEIVDEDGNIIASTITQEATLLPDGTVVPSSIRQITLKTAQEDNAYFAAGTEYFEVSDIPVDEVALYYLHYTNAGNNGQNTFDGYTKLAIVEQSTDNTIAAEGDHKKISVYPAEAAVNPDDPSTLYNNPEHIYRTDYGYRVYESVKGSDRYYYVVDDDVDNVAVYLEAESRSASVSIGNIPVNSDHYQQKLINSEFVGPTQISKHETYFDVQDIAIDGNIKNTVLYVSSQAAAEAAYPTAANEMAYPLTIYKESLATSVSGVTVSASGTDYEARMVGQDEQGYVVYEVVIPNTISKVDIKTSAGIEEAAVYYSGTDKNPSLGPEYSVSTYKDFVLDKSEIVESEDITIRTGNKSKNYKLNILKISEENDPYVSVNGGEGITPTINGWYVDTISIDDTEATVKVVTVVPGAKIQIEDSTPKLTVAQETVTVPSEFRTLGYFDVDFTLLYTNNTSDNHKVRLYANEADVRAEYVKVNGVEAEYDTTYNQYVVFIPEDAMNDDGSALTLNIEAKPYSDNAKSVIAQTRADAENALAAANISTYVGAANNIMNDFYIKVEPEDTAYSTATVYKLLVVKESHDITAQANTAAFTTYSTAVPDSENAAVLTAKIYYDAKGANLRIKPVHMYESIAIDSSGKYKSLEAGKEYIEFSNVTLRPIDDNITETIVNIYVKTPGDTNSGKHYELHLSYMTSNLKLKELDELTTYKGKIQQITDKDYNYRLAVSEADAKGNPESSTIQSEDGLVTIKAVAEDSKNIVSVDITGDGTFNTVGTGSVEATARIDNFIKDNAPTGKYLQVKVTSENGEEFIYKILLELQSTDITIDGDNGYVKAVKIGEDDPKLAAKPIYITNEETTKNVIDLNRAYFALVGGLDASTPIKVVANDQYAKIAVGDFMTAGSVSGKTDAEIKDLIRRNKLLDDKYTSMRVYENTAYSLEGANLSEGVVVPIGIMAENGSTEIYFLVLREDKSNLSISKVEILNDDGTWKEANAPVEDGDKNFTIGVPDGINNIIIRVTPVRNDVRYIFINGDNVEELDNYEKVLDGNTLTFKKKSQYLAWTSDSDEVAVPIAVYADNGGVVDNGDGTVSGLLTNEDKPYYLVVRKLSKDAGVVEITANPGTRYENSDNSARAEVIGDVTYSAYDLFINEDTSKTSYNETFTINLSDKNAKVTINGAEYEPTVTEDGKNLVTFDQTLVDKQDGKYKIDFIVTAEAGNTEHYVIYAEPQNLNISLDYLQYVGRDVTDYDEATKTYTQFIDRSDAIGPNYLYASSTLGTEIRVKVAETTYESGSNIFADTVIFDSQTENGETYSKYTIEVVKTFNNGEEFVRTYYLMAKVKSSNNKLEKVIVNGKEYVAGTDFVSADGVITVPVSKTSNTISVQAVTVNEYALVGIDNDTPANTHIDIKQNIEIPEIQEGDTYAYIPIYVTAQDGTKF